MSQRLHIQGDYPANWDEIGDRVREEAGHRCIRCKHPFRTGAHGKGQWSPCDEQCTHLGPIAVLYPPSCSGDDEDVETRITRLSPQIAGPLVALRKGHHASQIVAEWRILTVHHLDGNKSNCAWWNLLSLCQRCHLTVQSRVNPQHPYFLEHSDWFKPYVAGFYAKKYEGRLITREEAMQRLDELLAYERLA
jgi:hypothetical protein